ncbi:unnamed protein product [Rhizoctonia solani]|uniref:Uncharacterized protein n=1 Tax=Rhizoctonia solani TaxID=456999 RepID=A0A8H3I0B6_9AGAM|nr:unnamed protein product [Rhizoctonia solani]
MPKPSHPRWGRIIGSYPPSDINGSTLSMDSEATGLRAMREIAGLATDIRIPAPTQLANKSNSISIHSLQLALRLSQDPMKMHHLADPPVISSCIRLMKAIVGQTSGVASPFSYEFGYLCFRLLVITLNTCLLDRWGRLDQAQARLDQYPHVAAHVLISMEVSLAVHKQFENIVNGGDCDTVLGLPTSNTQRRPQKPALLSPSEIETLLDVIWDDRKLFLRALMLDVPIASGLSGLLFLFARRVAQESDSQQDPSPLRRKLYELALRYCLVQDSSQIVSTLNVISSSPCYGGWINTAKHVDAEDSRWIMTSFIKRLSERSDPDDLIKEDVSMMLRYVPLSTDTLTQDLLPEVLKYSIEYGWSLLLAREDKNEIRLAVHTLLPTLMYNKLVDISSPQPTLSLRVIDSNPGLRHNAQG